ncbi:MAG: hypothetical protein ACJAS4_000402 [Bacteriovoracaceae bacterium]|jgi:hypothetical protein
MLKAVCPSCGGEIIFRSSNSVLAVCTYCRSNIVRHDTNLELIGKQSDLLPDMSPLQIGVSGKYEHMRFQVVGRQIMKWKNGQWNEWYIIFSDGSDGWLAEAQGEFSILRKPKKQPKLPSPSEISKLHTIEIDKLHFKLIDKKKVTCLGSEGELPFKAVEGDKSLTMDFSDGNEGFASVEVLSDGEVLIYVGAFTSLKKMSVSGIRRFEGWEKL